MHRTSRGPALCIVSISTVILHMSQGHSIPWLPPSRRHHLIVMSNNRHWAYLEVSLVPIVMVVGPTVRRTTLFRGWVRALGSTRSSRSHHSAEPSPARKRLTLLITEYELGGTQCISTRILHFKLSPSFLNFVPVSHRVSPMPPHLQHGMLKLEIKSIVIFAQACRQQYYVSSFAISKNNS